MAVTSKHRRILTVLLMLAVFCSMMPAMGIPAHAAVKKQKTTVKSPQNLKIKKNESKLTISVSWKTQKKADRVQIQLKKGKAKYKTVKVTSKKSTVLKGFKTGKDYRLRIRAVRTVKKFGKKPCLASVNLVNETVPTIKLSENGSIESGQNIHFQIDNMITGIKDPVERVTLTNPKGNTEELKNIDDYFLYGNTGLFVLYNDVNAKNGKNHTEYTGKYTLTIEAAGFKTISKSFEVIGGKYAGGKSAASNYKVDAVTRATSIGGGSSSGSGSGL